MIEYEEIREQVQFLRESIVESLKDEFPIRYPVVLRIARSVAACYSKELKELQEEDFEEEEDEELEEEEYE